MNSTASPEVSYAVESTDGNRIAVYEYGNKSGIELVFLHGFATDHHVWFQQYKASALTDCCRIIVLDIRGHGQSFVEDCDYSNNDLWADDLYSVLGKTNIKKPVVVACSYGARMINDYLLRYGSTAIAGINYVAAASLNNPAFIGPDHQLLMSMCSEKENECMQANQQFMHKIFGDIEQADEYELIRKAIEIIPSNVKLQLRNRALIYDDLLASLSVPVMVTHGENDSFVSPDLSRELAKTVLNGQVSIYENAGHAPFVSQAQRFNRELIDFVKRAESMH